MEAVILCQKRTGSTFLQEAIDSHPHISSFDEMFMVVTELTERRGCELYKTMADKGYDIPKYLDWLASKDVNTVFRLIYNQNDTWGVLKHIKERGMSIIHLRRDPVDVVVSLQCKFKHIKPEDTVEVNKQKFESLVNLHTKTLQEYANRLNDYDKVLTLEYRDIFGHTEGNRDNIDFVGSFNIRSDQKTYIREDINKAICDFLNVDNVSMYSTVTKKFTLPREQKISNWNELNVPQY
jgi:hypothetical protein